MDFTHDEDCRMPMNRAQRRDRDSSFAHKKQEKKDAKATARSRSASVSADKVDAADQTAAPTPLNESDAVNVDGKAAKTRGRTASATDQIVQHVDSTTPVKPRKRSKKRSSSEGEENEEQQEEVELEEGQITIKLQPMLSTPVKTTEEVKDLSEACRSRSRTAKSEEQGAADLAANHRRKTSKSAVKRQLEAEVKQNSRHASATALEKQKEEEAIAADAEAAAARRRSVWEAKENVANLDLALKIEGEKSKNADDREEHLLEALEAEAQAAGAAMAALFPALLPDGKKSAPDAHFRKDRADLIAALDLEDPDLEGWEVL